MIFIDEMFCKCCGICVRFCPKNVLEISTPPGNPKGIKTFADLAKPGVNVVVCAPAVPCGAAEQTIEKATGTKLSPVSQETDVKAVLTKVQTGNADVQRVFENLLRGSENHLRAFVQALSARDQDYQPHYLTHDAYETILNGASGNGFGQGGNGSQARGQGNRGRTEH